MSLPTLTFFITDYSYTHTPYCQCLILDTHILQGRAGISSVQSPSPVRLFETAWTAAPQASPSITNSRSLLKLMSIESVMPSNHLILCHPFSFCLQSFPASGSFPMSQFFVSGGQNIGASASISVLPMNIQDWFPLGLTGFFLLAVQETLKSLLQHHSSKASNLYLLVLLEAWLNFAFLLQGKTSVPSVKTYRCVEFIEWSK